MEQDPTSEKWVYVPPASPEDSQRPTSSSFSDYPEEGQRPFKRKNDNYRGNSRGRGRGGFYNDRGRGGGQQNKWQPNPRPRSQPDSDYQRPYKQQYIPPSPPPLPKREVKIIERRDNLIPLKYPYENETNANYFCQEVSSLFVVNYDEVRDGICEVLKKSKDGIDEW